MLFALGVILLILKLAGVIAWSWWIVLIPFYFLVVIMALYMVALVAAALSKK